jgi:hypothetical protein
VEFFRKAINRVQEPVVVMVWVTVARSRKLRNLKGISLAGKNPVRRANRPTRSKILILLKHRTTSPGAKPLEEPIFSKSAVKPLIPLNPASARYPMAEAFLA